MPKKDSGKGPKSKTPSKKTTSGSVGAGLTILSEKTLFLGQSLSVVQGNIADVEVDAIVHPTNGNFNLAGEVGKHFSSNFKSITNNHAAYQIIRGKNLLNIDLVQCVLMVCMWLL